METRTFIVVGLAAHAQTTATTRQLFFRRVCLWTGLLAFATMAFGPRPAQAAMTEAWVQRYGSEAESEDRASKVVTDAAGNVIVAGSTVIKYSGAGAPLWTNRYNGEVRAAAVDGSGNVFVTGSSGSGYLTIAYSGAGVPLWTNQYPGDHVHDNGVAAIAVDGSGNVFVTGTSAYPLGNVDYATIAYSGAGVPLWTNRYNGPANSSDWATALAVDASGNVFVTGASDSRPPGPGWESSYDFATVAYSGAGVRLWTKRYNGYGDDEPRAVAVDASGNVFVTGTSQDGNYSTVAYSGAGVALWTNRYGGPGDTVDIAKAMAVDGSGNVFVTGYSAGTGGKSDYATIAYSGAGLPLWTNRYNAGYGTDIPNAVAVDASGNVFVAGYSGTIAYSGAGVPIWTNGGGAAIAVDGSGNVFVTASSRGSEGDSDYATFAYSGTGVALWTNRYGGREETWDIANGVAVDANGNVFVTGSSAGGGGSAYATMAYSGAGVPLWTNRYQRSAPSYDQATAVAVDGGGKVFVTGSSYGSGGHSDYATIAYSGAGVALWSNRWDGPENGDDVASAMAVDAGGNVIVTGSSGASGGGSDCATIKYSGVGVPLWTNLYNNGYSTRATAVAVDGSGNVFLTAGSSLGDYATIAYSGAGVPLWTNLYSESGYLTDQATDVAVDGSGNVFVTGSSVGDYATIAYSGSGVALWTNRYDGPANGHDGASAVAVDGSGNVLVTGASGGDYVTIAYSGAGVPLWTNRYNGPGNWEDQATAIAVDARGNVFVTGNSTGSGGSYDYATIAYSGAGVPLWTNRNIRPVYIPGGAYSKSSLAIGSDGAVHVTGASEVGLYSCDFVTVKYVWRSELAIQLPSTIPPNVNLTLSAAPNSSWAIERALEPAGPWTNLSALLIGANGAAQFQDTNPPSPAGFYRSRPQ